MAVDESLGALSSVAVSNTPGGADTVGPDLDDHLRDIKKNIRIAGETSQGPTAPTGFIGRQRLATSATGSNTLTHQMHDGSAYRSLYDLDTSAGTISRFYTRKGSMPGEAVSGTLSGISVVSSFFDGSATGTFRGFFTGSASGRFTGDVRLEDGSSAAPALAFTDDTNSGIFRSGADAWGFVAGSRRQFKIRDDDTIETRLAKKWFVTKTDIPDNATTSVARVSLNADEVGAHVNVRVQTEVDLGGSVTRWGMSEFSFGCGRQSSGTAVVDVVTTATEGSPGTAAVVSSLSTNATTNAIDITIFVADLSTANNLSMVMEVDVLSHNLGQISVSAL